MFFVNFLDFLIEENLKIKINQNCVVFYVVYDEYLTNYDGRTELKSTQS